MKHSISDDDLCSDCAHCIYRPGEMSDCVEAWPGIIAPDDHPRACYIIECEKFKRIRTWGSNIPNELKGR